MKCITFQSDGKKWFYPTTVDEALSLSKQFPKAVFRQGGTGMCSIKIKLFKLALQFRCKFLENWSLILK